MTIDPRAYPILRWRWRVGNVLEKGDVRRKAGDDYPARLYVTFAYEPDQVSLGKKLKYLAGQALFGAIPIAALNYIWDGKSPVGTLVDNAFTDFAKMIVVESGSTKVGAWVEEERNVYEDYRLAFGEDPPAINGIAIMTDTDNTQERAVAYYGDIVFLQAAKPAPSRVDERGVRNLPFRCQPPSSPVRCESQQRSCLPPTHRRMYEAGDLGSRWVVDVSCLIGIRASKYARHRSAAGQSRAAHRPGIAGGQLNEREARRLNAQQEHINRMEDRAKSDGVMTRRERTKLNHAQDRASRHIARQKHDRQQR